MLSLTPIGSPASLLRGQQHSYLKALISSPRPYVLLEHKTSPLNGFMVNAPTADSCKIHHNLCGVDFIYRPHTAAN